MLIFFLSFPKTIKAPSQKAGRGGEQPRLLTCPPKAGGISRREMRRAAALWEERRVIAPRNGRYLHYYYMKIWQEGE